MRATQRRFDPGLIEHSLREPERYEFFQLVRLYERFFRSSEMGGYVQDPIGERIRFRNSLRMGFAPSQVDAIQGEFRQDEDGLATGELDRVEITPSFMGMLGVNGTLPIHYTERVIDNAYFLRDVSGRAFLDMFTNRALGQFYRAWKKYRLAIQYETDRRNRYLPLVLSLGGLGFDSLKQRLNARPGAIEDESIAYFCGLLRQRPVSAEGLQKILSGYFREPVRIEQFVGYWYVLPEQQRTILGGRNATLGRDALAGERVWQRNLRLRIHLGPLGHAAYMAFLPKGEFAAALEKLLSLATGGQFEYEIRPVLRAEEVRPATLKGAGCRLGYDTFMITRPETRDRGDTAYLTRFIH